MQIARHCCNFIQWALDSLLSLGYPSFREIIHLLHANYANRIILLLLHTFAGQKSAVLNLDYLLLTFTSSLTSAAFTSKCWKRAVCFVESNPVRSKEWHTDSNPFTVVTLNHFFHVSIQTTDGEVFLTQCFKYVDFDALVTFFWLILLVRSWPSTRISLGIISHTAYTVTSLLAANSNHCIFWTEWYVIWI